MYFRRGFFFFYGLIATCFVVAAALPVSAQTDAEPPITPLLKCWNRPSEISAVAGTAADSETVYFVTDKSTLSAVDIGSGEPVWSSEVGGSISTAILASGNAVYVVSTGEADAAKKKSAIRAINRVSGITNWSVELPWAEEYFLGETAAGITVVASNGSIQTLRPSDGVYVWKTLFTGRPSATPDISSTEITIGVAGKKIEVFAPLEAKRSIRIKSDSATIARALRGIAIYADDRGEIFSVDVSDSGRNWSYKTGGKITDITPVGGNVLVSSADNFVYLISIDNGHILWKRRMPGRIADVELVATDQAAVTVIGERSAFILEMDKGRVANQINLEGEDSFLTTPIRANGKYIVTATADGISAFSTECGTRKPPVAK